MVLLENTEGMIASMLAVLNPPATRLWFSNRSTRTTIRTRSFAAPRRRYVRLHPPDWRFDPDELRSAFTTRTKAIVLNPPNNPTGKVFSRDELAVIAELCQEFDALAITDEIYDHIVYDGAVHVQIASLPAWRVGWVLAPPDLTGSIRKAQDFLIVGAAAPPSGPAYVHHV
jgi:aspartate/methionine/tyrosine aminotransferase